MADRVVPKDGGYALPLRDSVRNTEQIDLDDIVHVSEWLLRLTPAAGFAVRQTMVHYPQVVAHYAPSAGYFPLPGWPGSPCSARTR